MPIYSGTVVECNDLLIANECNGFVTILQTSEIIVEGKQIVALNVTFHTITNWVSIPGITKCTEGNVCDDGQCEGFSSTFSIG